VNLLIERPWGFILGHSVSNGPVLDRKEADQNRIGSQRWVKWTSAQNQKRTGVKGELWLEERTV